MTISRRRLLGALTAPAVGAAAAPWAASLAGLAALSSHAASGGDDYRALVCLFMHGGNDSHNWLIPLEASEYAEYARTRTALALPAETLLPLSRAPQQAAGRRFGVAPELAPLRELYETGELAWVANVGALQQPTTRADFDAGRGLPPRLFSHNDQASHWQALGPEGTRSGWGGRLADALASLNAVPAFTAVSAAGNAVFVSGIGQSGYQIAPAGPVAIEALARPYTFSSGSAAAALRQMHIQEAAHPMQAEYARIVRRSAAAHGMLSPAMSQANVLPLPDATLRLANGSSVALGQLPLMRQLRAVAQMIAAAPGLGLRRQVFLVSATGFDTHGSQLRDHPALSAGLAHSVAWFLGAVRAMGRADGVTLFSASDFGRTLISNGGGSDHGWGSHQFVAGAAVRGREIYGRFPTLALGSPDEVGSGRLLPSTAVSAYAAPLARWMGVGAADLPAVLPGVSRFDTGALAYL